jgi:DNA-binding Lrp family transcriptional regulator
MTKLLELLKENARYTNEQLATFLSVSVDDIEKQIKDLEDKGVIRGYTTIINEEQIDSNKITATIELKVSPRKDTGFDAIAAEIMRFPEVTSLKLMSGAYDMILDLVGASVKEIGLFVSRKLSTISGIRSTATYFILKRYKSKGVCLIDSDEDTRELTIYD